MEKLGVREAANRIRQQAELDRSLRTSPEDAHALKFAKEVAVELGFDANKAEDVFHVFQLLREHDIAPHTGQEWPKYVQRKRDGAMVIADNPEHADKIINEEPPAPAENPPGMFVNPGDPNALHDISDKVPTVKQDGMADVLKRNEAHPGDRQPSDVSDLVPHTGPGGEAKEDVKSELELTTDREAAQDQLPLGASHGDEVVVVDPTSGIDTDHDKGVMAHDDPDRDGRPGQAPDPTHDNNPGTKKHHHRKRPE